MPFTTGHPKTPGTRTLMILYVVRAAVCGDYCLRLEFNDGTSKRVDLRPLLWGPIFEPLLDPSFFTRMELDEEFGVVQWPNGADLAPEALHALDDLDAVPAARTQTAWTARPIPSDIPEAERASDRRIRDLKFIL